MRHISTILGAHLPSDYKESIKILKQVFSSMNYAFSLENMIFQDYVEVFGLNEFSTSMNALESFTKQSSSEFAIRRFILKYPDQSMQQMLLWTASNNADVRRLASEGCRPRLPWAVSLPLFKKNPAKVLEILTLLKDDESKYVRKSVSNNLNDISKDNPETLKRVTREWIGESKQRDSLLKHGCRTLLKNSDKDILQLFGFKEPTHLELKKFQFTKDVKLGKSLNFSFEIVSKEALGQIRVEFSLEFLRKNGLRNRKVFKISEANVLKNNKSVSKSYSFKKISTRLYYRGEQSISIIINGIEFISKEFTLY